MTSSSLKGLMIASIFFMISPWVGTIAVKKSHAGVNGSDRVPVFIGDRIAPILAETA